MLKNIFGLTCPQALQILEVFDSLTSLKVLPYNFDCILIGV
jgi:hypothetical protein